jgi:carbamoyltransferase
MALAALGKSTRYLDDFRRFLREDLEKACSRAPGHVKHTSVRDPSFPRHPFLGRWRDEARADPQAKYDMALALQLATEEQIRDIIVEGLRLNPSKNLCIAGGVALNSVAMGKIRDWFPDLNVFIPPVPYDGGLTIGAAQYVWHHVLDNPRVDWKDNPSPYLGKRYTREEVLTAISEHPEQEKLFFEPVDDDDVLSLLESGQIVSVFNGSAESGRRALGNRSILADPRHPDMKDKINEKVKHRQWFRPFAPSLAIEGMADLFENPQESPYMGFVCRFKPEVRDKLPAVVHFDGTARLQTVTASDNPWYHSFLSRWGERSGYPILLNTSFNDREPICETPHHAVRCFVETDIDAMYFPEHGMLVRKRS